MPTPTVGIVLSQIKICTGLYPCGDDLCPRTTSMRRHTWEAPEGRPEIGVSKPAAVYLGRKVNMAQDITMGTGTRGDAIRGNKNIIIQSSS